MFLAGWSYEDIADKIVKADGSHPCQQSVADNVDYCESHGGLKWNGEVDTSGRGRPRKTTTALDRKIVKLVFRYRGSAKITVDFLRKKIPSAKKISKRTISRRLEDAGLAWLRSLLELFRTIQGHLELSGAMSTYPKPTRAI